MFTFQIRLSLSFSSNLFLKHNKSFLYDSTVSSESALKMFISSFAAPSASSVQYENAPTQLQNHSLSNTLSCLKNVPLECKLLNGGEQPEEALGRLSVLGEFGGEGHGGGGGGSSRRLRDVIKGQRVGEEEGRGKRKGEEGGEEKRRQRLETVWEEEEVGGVEDVGVEGEGGNNNQGGGREKVMDGKGAEAVVRRRERRGEFTRSRGPKEGSSCWGEIRWGQERMRGWSLMGQGGGEG